MSGQGRPIRFLAGVAVGWVGLRVVLLWSQTGSLPEAIKGVVPLPPRIVASIGAVAGPAASAPADVRRARARPADAPGDLPRSRPISAIEGDPTRIQMALLGLIQYGAPAAIGGAAEALPLAAQPEWLPAPPSRWSASAWLAVRPGTGLGAAPGANQLGGSQAGVRVAYMLWPSQRVAGFARVAAPLRGKGAEASLGIEWQPSAAPLRIVAEQRFGLDGARGGPGLGIVEGFDGSLAPGFSLESYGQAGAIRRARIEPYADGAIRLTKTLGERRGMRLGLGGGAWGAAQRDAARLDIGPSATLAMPLAGQNVRIAVDWRQRVAGGARPGSGPALTLGSDF